MLRARAAPPSPPRPRRRAFPLALLLVAAASASTAGAQSEQDVLAPEQRAWLAQHGPIRVAFAPTGPPFELVSADGRISGINADVLALLTVKTGIEFDVSRPASFPAVYAGIENGTFDAFMIAVRTPDREDALDWTAPYAWARTGFWTTDRTPDIASPADLEGRRVARVNNAVHGAYLNESFPGIEQVVYRDAKEASAALAAGEVDAMYGGHANTGYYVRSLGYDGFRTIGGTNVAQVAIGVKDGNDEALAILDAGLAQLGRDELLAVYVKWTGQDLGPPATAAAGLVLTPVHKGLIAGGVGTILLLGAGTVVLRRQVAARTVELQALNGQLERKVEERTRELAERNEELQVFSAAVSHDLRSRLTAADGFTRVLLRTQDKRLDAQGLAYLERLDATHRRMSDLVEDVLSLSRVARATVARERVDVSALAREVAAELREDQPTRRVELVVQDGLVADADPASLRVALENLLANAWKYSSEREEARVEVGAASSPRGRAFFVRDNGAGFDAAAADGLFQPFRRFHDAERFPGVGLGLAIVRRVALRHGGDAWAESRPGEGATFWFTLGGVAS